MFKRLEWQVPPTKPLNGKQTCTNDAAHKATKWHGAFILWVLPLTHRKHIQIRIEAKPSAVERAGLQGARLHCILQAFLKNNFIYNCIRTGGIWSSSPQKMEES